MQVCIKFLTEAKLNIQERFPDSSLEVLNASSLLEANSYEPTDGYGDEQLKVLARHFMIDEDKLQEEWSVVRPTISYIHDKQTHSQRQLFATINSLLRIHDNDDTILNIKKIMCTYLVLPMSSVDAERGFSCLKLIKVRLRNSLGAVNLNNAMLAAIEGPSIDRFNFAQCIELFKSTKRRRVV